MAEKETYNMIYKCCNCYTQFQTSILKGTEALGNGGKCPYCGVDDYLDDDDGSDTHKVMGAPVLD